ncbi:MAG: hypothetical protein GXY83_32275 [Rhodopirellula sp.]|nr:hypothetical protein [Rhodopirellula sp.]
MPQSKQTHVRPDSPEKSTAPAHPSDPPRQGASAHHPPTASTAAEPGDNAPCWLPRGDAWRRLPEPIRRAVHQRILPMCKALVDGAPDQIERSAAATLVYLTWLEIRGQIELEQARDLSDPLVPARADTDQLLARHLRLLTAKHRNSELLAKLRLARENSARRQSPAANHPPSAFFDNPLGPRRCVPSVPSDAARESRPSRVERPVPEDPEEQDRPTQLPQREVQRDPTAQFDPQRDKTDPPNVSLKSERGVARRQTAGADVRIRRLDAQQEREKS